MVTEIDLKYYYTQFQKEAYSIIPGLVADKKEKILIADKIKELILVNKSTCNKYNIDTDKLFDTNYAEVLKQYNIKDYFIYLNNPRFDEMSSIANNIIKYINAVKKIYIYDLKINAAYNRRKVTFAVYKDIVKKFYRYGVHKCVLEGYAYKFADNLGYLIINKWKIPKEEIINGSRKKVDYNKTNAKRKELLAKGGIPYNKEDAEIARQKGIKYNGEKYIVYKNHSDIYEITIVGKSDCIFKRASSIREPLRNKTQKQIAEECKTAEDVYKLPCDLFHKLGIYNYFDPTAYLNYIRNEEQNKLTFGAHNCKNRKRFQS